MKTPTVYDEVLEIAGAKVLEFKMFGSYQGDWIAKIEYDGQIGYIRDYYGSCSGCDALEATFDYADEVPLQKVVDFAKPYLNEILTFDECLKKASENLEWDTEADEMVKWLKEINQIS